MPPVALLVTEPVPLASSADDPSVAAAAVTVTGASASIVGGSPLKSLCILLSCDSAALRLTSTSVASGPSLLAMNSSRNSKTSSLEACCGCCRACTTTGVFNVVAATNPGLLLFNILLCSRCDESSGLQCPLQRARFHIFPSHLKAVSESTVRIDCPDCLSNCPTPLSGVRRAQVPRHTATPPSARATLQPSRLARTNPRSQLPHYYSTSSRISPPLSPRGPRTFYEKQKLSG